MLGSGMLSSGRRGTLSTLAVPCVLATTLALCTAPVTSGAVRGWDSSTASALGEASLAAVSCASTRSCTAVGSSGSGVLVESWDGRTWSLAPTPAISGGVAVLNGVSCTSPRSCVAVGDMSSSGGAAYDLRPLVESWDGSHWSVAHSPGLGLASATLNGVSCASTESCMAVGNDRSTTLAERWDGAVWSVVASRAPGSYGGFSGLFCSSASSCTAVGNFSYGTGSASSILPRALVESWDGRSWSVPPLPGPSVAHLYGVACALRACQAVGGYTSAAGTTRSLAEFWDGSAWSMVPSPSLPTAELDGVACATEEFCVAVGQYSKSLVGPSPSGALIETWDGTAWSVHA